MNVENYTKNFIQKAEQVGYSAENIEKCLSYAIPLIEKNLPIVYNVTHLSGLVGYKSSYIGRAVVFTHFFYRHFEIKKKNGSNRNISEPLPSLKEIQYWILTNILYKIPVSKFAKAYVPGITLKQNLVFHKGQQQVLKLDIRDFFGSIRRNQVEKIFRHSGYSYSVSNILSKLCCLYESLPQGASTSAYISNLILVDFDKTLSEFCLSKHIRYTRYADDISFSGDFDSHYMVNFVSVELKKISLELNTKKTRLMKQGQKQLVTGVVVNNKIQVGRIKRKEIRQEVYYIKRFGLQEHLLRMGNKKSNYIAHLRGKILFVLFINPEDSEFLSYKKFVNTL